MAKIPDVKQKGVDLPQTFFLVLPRGDQRDDTPAHFTIRPRIQPIKLTRSRTGRLRALGGREGPQQLLHRLDVVLLVVGGLPVDSQGCGERLH